MKILIVDTYYPEVLVAIYRNDSELASRPYAEQLHALYKLRFGTSDYYSRNLRSLGHDAADVVANCVPMQRQWLRDNRLASTVGSRVRVDKGWQFDVVDAQVQAAQPDVVYIQDINYFPDQWVSVLHRSAPLVVGQTAYAIDWDSPRRGFDLMISSIPSYVERFRSAGVPAEYLRIGFEATVLDEVPAGERDIDVSFVGALELQTHTRGTAVMEALTTALPIKVWGYGAKLLSPQSELRRAYQGEAWGLDMYRVYARSKVVVNRHSRVAAGYVNNMRLYESTGMGACLVTDVGSNLTQLFEPGREVVPYTDVDDAIAKIRHLLQNDPEREAIAVAGQRRTLADHTYLARMEELAALLERHLAHAQRSRGDKSAGSKTWRRTRVTPREVAKSVLTETPFAPSLRRFRQRVRWRLRSPN